jgi:hypothetical protein
MKSRWQELLDKSIAAMLSAIEIYNKPDFKYREETFSILAINSWELMLKAAWLRENGNKVRSLYVLEKRVKADGSASKFQRIKLTASGNPFTHSLDYLAKKLVEKGKLPRVVAANIEALCEIRDSAVHFYNKSALFAVRLQEVGSATVRNYAGLVQVWFTEDLSKYNFYLMPLAFVTPERTADIVVLGKEEKKVAEFISSLEAQTVPDGNFAVSLNFELKFLKSKADDALKVQYSNDVDVTKVHLTEDQMKERYPLVYATVAEGARARYKDFKQNRTFHKILAALKPDRKYCYVRHLDLANPRSAKQEWYSQAVFNILDRHYRR